jgi:hypothetical protein
MCLALLMTFNNVMIWLVAILLLFIFAGIGYLKGAIRMSLSLAGLFIGLLAAKPMAPLMTPIYTASGVTNLVWLAVLPPITAFFVVGLIFIGIGFFVHYKVSQYYKYGADEVTRLTWERMNKRSGAALGLMVGGIYAILIGMLIYVAGYFTTQVATESDTGMLAQLNGLANGLESSGMGKIARSITSVPEKYFKVSDVLGLSHKNPLLEVRYRNYPTLLKFGNDATIEELASDDAYHSLLVQQASLQEIFPHPISQKIMSDPNLSDRLLSTDLDDLQTYLETGESPKYADELLLGRWELDVNSTINYFKKNILTTQLDTSISPGGKQLTKSAQIRIMKEIVGNMLAGTTMIVYPDKTLAVSGPQQAEPEEAPQEEPAFDDPYGGMDSRYFPQGGAPGAAAAAQQQRQQQQQAAKPSYTPEFTEGAQWENISRGRYTISDRGSNDKSDVVVKKNHRAYITSKRMTLVFKRVW